MRVSLGFNHGDPPSDQIKDQSNETEDDTKKEEYKIKCGLEWNPPEIADWIARECKKITWGYEKD